MLIVISPSKTLDLTSPIATRKKSDPQFLDRTASLIGTLRQFPSTQLSELMNISESLADLNAKRYQDWTSDTTEARPALLTFQGDVYLGLGATDFSERDLTYAQRRLRILSGLYGMLKPLDRIHPYRLEMGTTLRHAGTQSLYEYWNTTIGTALNDELAQHKKPLLINLASSEYFSPALRKLVEPRILDCTFLDRHRDDYRFMSYYGKKARGLMARHILKNRIDTLAGIKSFSGAGYYFSPARSHRSKFVFLRDDIPQDV